MGFGGTPCGSRRRCLGDGAPIRNSSLLNLPGFHVKTHILDQAQALSKAASQLLGLERAEAVLEEEIRSRLARIKSRGVSWHFESSESLAPILAALYGSWVVEGLRSGVDRHVIVSKGHGSLAYYALLEALGLVEVGSVEEGFATPASPFQAHPEMGKTPLTPVSTGSLGQGLSIAIGLALSGRLAKSRREVAVVLGDGELDEGQVWEAAATASTFNLEEVVAIIDRNGGQHTGPTELVKRKEPLADRWRSFGWRVIEVPATSHAVAWALRQAGSGGRPLAVIVRS